MPSEDFSYFRARAVEERERALAAASPTVRAVHLDFAGRYDRMATGLHPAEELQLSHDAVRRSLSLLRAKHLANEDQRASLARLEGECL